MPDFETLKRLEIAKNIRLEIFEHCAAIILAGSMGFGQNYSVNSDSDIDMVVVCDKNQFKSLRKIKGFLDNVDNYALQNFDKKIIDFFWVSKLIDEIEVNIFIYDKDAYVDFCLLKKDLIGFNNKKPNDFQYGFDFKGNNLRIDRNVREFKNGFLYEKPTLIEDKFWGCVPRQDFLYSAHCLHEQDEFFKKLDSKVWEKIVEQMIKEHGSSINLEEINILNTHYTYQTTPERVPENVVFKIKERTKTEINKKLF